MLLSQTQDPSRDIYLWMGALILAAVVLAVVAMILRKLLIGRDQAPMIGFTLADLRELHARGEISDEEFASAKGRMLAQGRASLDDSEKSSSGAPPVEAAAGGAGNESDFGEDSANTVDESDGAAGSPDKNP